MKNAENSNLRILLFINALILGASGTFAVLLPARVCSLYGVAVNPEVMMMAQYAGLGSVAVALFAWFGRRVTDPRVLRGLTIALFITHAAGAVISLLNTISGVISLGWPIFVLYTLLAIGYGYFLFAVRSRH